MATVNIVVTCAKRKTQPAVPELTLGSVSGRTVEERGRKWLLRLRSTRAEQVAAEELYAGEHWGIARSLAGLTLADRYGVRLWICSAGYGLLSPASRVSGYSATFAAGQPDSVDRGLRGIEPRQARRVWWHLLSQWEGPEPVNPRSISQLALDQPRFPLLVVISEVYLHALADDLREAVHSLAEPELLSILSAGGSTEDELADHLLPCDARLQSLVGGARHSLNVRVARKVLGELGHKPPTLPVLRDCLARLLASLPMAPPSRRISLADGELKRYITAALRQDSRRRPTPLLQQLRAEGYACEHSRFSDLFQEVSGQLHGA